jgi:hypothetical protein
MSLPYPRFGISDSIAIISASIMTWLGLRIKLWYWPPWTYEVISDLTLSSRSEFFSMFVWPAMIFLSTSSVFLVRSIRGGLDRFTPLGKVALAWPIASFVLLNVHCVSGLCTLPFGIVMSISSTIAYKDEQDHLIPIVWSVVWLCFGAFYFYRSLVSSQ